MDLIKLNQTNGRPRAFYGVSLFDESWDHERSCPKDRDSVRWMNVRIYKEDIGGYRVGIARLTCFDTERDELIATPNLPNKEEAMEFISDHAPDFVKQAMECLYPKKKAKDERLGSGVEQKPL